jgi:hypothetical protein
VYISTTSEAIFICDGATSVSWRQPFQSYAPIVILKSIKDCFKDFMSANSVQVLENIKFYAKKISSSREISREIIARNGENH